jgi:hypothetical protein
LNSIFIVLDFLELQTALFYEPREEGVKVLAASGQLLGVSSVGRFSVRVLDVSGSLVVKSHFPGEREVRATTRGLHVTTGVEYFNRADVCIERADFRHAGR